MPTMALIPRYLLAALALTRLSLQAKDPIKEFCRRWGHQTAEVDGKLYIDGGMVAWNPLSTNPRNYTNTWLVYSDLNSTTQTVGMPDQYANLTKNSTVPSVSGGVLWADKVNKCFYQFGGQFQDSPIDFSFWTYDTVLDQWNETSPKSNVNSLQRVAFGAGTQIQDLGLGFYFGGWMSNMTSPSWGGLPMASNNLISYDFSTNTLNNNSGPSDNLGRAEGQLVYLPASDGGLLAYFGGVEDPHQNGSYVPANMSTIHIYDVSSAKWFTQTAAGDVPKSRRQFCAGATWADDQSSYNIYLYGGYGVDGGIGHDDAYVLSLPSFQWIKLFPTDNNTLLFPHGGCSANVINHDQMLIIGGSFPNSSFTECDSPGSQGQHNMNLGYNGASNTLWDKYQPTASRYFVPTPIVSVIGGGPTGGASMTKPSAWNNAQLGVFFTRQASFSARSATRVIPTGTGTPSDNKSGKTNVGAIAGGVVGGLAALIIILGLILLCLHRRKKALKANPSGRNKTPSPPPAELAATTPAAEMSSPGTVKYISLQQQPDPAFHPIYSNTNSIHSRSPSNDYMHPVSPYQAQGFQPGSPNSGTYPAVGTYSDHNQHVQQQPASYAENPNTYDPYLHHTQQQTYAYSSPTSPSHPPSLQHQQGQQQVYYPPPPEPSTHHLSHPSQSDRGGMGSPDSTLISAAGSSSPAQTSTQWAGSTTHTPAQFYAQPVPIRGANAMNGAGLAPGEEGYGQRSNSAGDAGSMRSVDTGGRRPVRGRFVEVGNM